MSEQASNPSRRFLNMVQDFRDWEVAWAPDKELSSCWEVNYERWGSLYAAAEAFLKQRPFRSWSPDELEAMLFALARDEDGRNLSHMIREGSPTLVVDLAEACVLRGEWPARWQLADELGHIGDEGGRRDAALLRLADDPNEYVRRRAMISLLALRHPDIERLAIESWSRPTEPDSRLFAKRMVLDVLEEIASPQLPRFLGEAERDPDPEVVEAATLIRGRQAAG